MAEPYVGEITIYSFNWAPQGWLPCDGRRLPVNQYQTLYSLIGNMYGGDATNFNLPDLRGRTVINQGTGPGLQPRTMGESSGAETVNLATNQIPSHSHTVRCNASGVNALTPVGNTITGNGKGDTTNRFSNADADSLMRDGNVAPAGGGQPHSNMQPYLVLNYCIAVEGMYPPRP